MILLNFCAIVYFVIVGAVLFAMAFDGFKWDLFFFQF